MNDAVPPTHEQTAGGSSASAGASSFPAVESMRLALEAGGVGAWSWDVQTDTVTWMGKLAEIHGIKAEDWSGTFSDFQKVIHSEDQAEVIVQLGARDRGGDRCHDCRRRGTGKSDEDHVPSGVLERAGVERLRLPPPEHHPVGALEDRYNDENDGHDDRTQSVDMWLYP